jgi:hypothetical protein
MLHEPLSKKSLTRRANHRHIFIIAKTTKPAPETGRGLLHLDLLNRTAAAFHGRTILQAAHRGKTRLKAGCRPNPF